MKNIKLKQNIINSNSKNTLNPVLTEEIRSMESELFQIQNELNDSKDDLLKELIANANGRINKITELQVS